MGKTWWGWVVGNRSILWREARGLPLYYGPERESIRCIVCGREWRPGGPEYVALWGRIGYRAQEGFLWSSDAMGMYAVPVGRADEHVQYVCREHGDRWEWLPNCYTGERVEMVPPPSVLQHWWRDGLYWSGTVLRFVWLCLEPLWNGDRITRPTMWPPLRAVRDE